MGFEIENGLLVKYTDEPGVTDVVIPEGVTEIGRRAFMGCTHMKQVTFPASLKTVGWQAFYRCTGLTSLDIPGTIQQFSFQAFARCTGITEVTIAENAARVGVYAFLECPSLRVIRLRPDDPAIPVDYSAMEDVGGCIDTAREIIRYGIWSERCSLKVKYPLLLLHYLHTQDAELGAYIKKNLTKMMKTAIEAGQLEMIRVIAQTGAFINKRNIAKFITLAQDEHQDAIADFLTDYQTQHLETEAK